MIINPRNIRQKLLDRSEPRTRQHVLGMLGWDRGGRDPHRCFSCHTEVPNLSGRDIPVCRDHATCIPHQLTCLHCHQPFYGKLYRNRGEIRKTLCFTCRRENSRITSSHHATQRLLDGLDDGLRSAVEEKLEFLLRRDRKELFNRDLLGHRLYPWSDHRVNLFFSTPLKNSVGTLLPEHCPKRVRNMKPDLVILILKNGKPHRWVPVELLGSIHHRDDVAEADERRWKIFSKMGPACIGLILLDHREFRNNAAVVSTPLVRAASRRLPKILEKLLVTSVLFRDLSSGRIRHRPRKNFRIIRLVLSPKKGRPFYARPRQSIRRSEWKS